MKIAILSDIHGNIFALKKCIEYINKRNIDTIIIFGDYISDIPRSHEVITYLKELNNKYKCYFVKGNREDYIIDYLNGNKKNWAMYNRHGSMLCVFNELDKYDIDFIKELSDSLDININGLPPIYVSHKHIDNIKGYKYIIYGHTHIPEYYNNQGIYYINPGSVGLGLSNGFCTEFAILSIDNDYTNVELINIKYDTEEVINSIKSSNLSKTITRWDEILIKTIEQGIDYSDLYIKKVLDKSKTLGIKNLDDVPISIWNDIRKELVLSKK